MPEIHKITPLEQSFPLNYTSHFSARTRKCKEGFKKRSKNNGSLYLPHPYLPLFSSFSIRHGSKNVGRRAFPLREFHNCQRWDQIRKTSSLNDGQSCSDGTLQNCDYAWHEHKGGYNIGFVRIIFRHTNGRRQEEWTGHSCSYHLQVMLHSLAKIFKTIIFPFLQHLQNLPVVEITWSPRNRHMYHGGTSSIPYSNSSPT